MTDDVRTIDYGERGSVIVTANGDALAARAASVLQATIATAASEGRRALVALSGGSTPKKMGALLADEPFASTVDWSAVDFFWGDERWVPLDDPESNAGEARRGFLDALPIDPDRVHPFQTEDVTPEESAAALEATIRFLQPDAPVPVFDLVLVGMGDDGHTASLFPGTPAIHDNHRLVVSNVVPKLDTTRLTFTPPLINAARRVAFLVGGAAKADMLHQVLDGPIEIDVTPCQVVRPTSGNLEWLIDEAAATGLDRHGDS